VVPGQYPDQPPEEERGEQRQDRLSSDREPQIHGGGEDSDGADDQDHLADVHRRAGDVDVREGLVKKQVAEEEGTEQPGVDDKRTVRPNPRPAGRVHDCVGPRAPAANG
jgi:hypothetical protein